jgi:hypothetical protein
MPSVLIIENYLQNVINIFGNEKHINVAISQRALIYDPAHPRDSKTPPNLSTLQNQFYANGNKRRSATFRFVDKDRAESDIQLFFRPDNITDRERIALLSIFYAATHFAFSPLNVLSRGTVEVMQIVIAKRIRDLAGFTTPLGYEPRPEMIAALRAMMKELDVIYEQCLTISDLNYHLLSTVPKLSRIKNNTKDKSVKHEFVVDILAAIGDFSRTHDFYKLFDMQSGFKCSLQVCCQLLMNFT